MINHMDRRKNCFRLAVLVTALAVLCLAAAAAEAGTLKLPEGLKEIQSQAFMGDKALGEVFVPGNTTTIGTYAFANSSLSIIHLPAGLKTIGDHAFDGCSNLTIYAPSGSKGLTYARENGIPCVTELSLGKKADAVFTGDGETVLFSFVPEANGIYKFISTGDYDTYGYLYDAEMEQLACDDDTGSERNFSIEYQLTAGKKYFFGAKHWSSGTATFSVRLSASVTWMLSGKVLTITSKGRMPDLTSGSLPWPSTITRIVINEGITYIGANAFNSCKKLKEVVIPDSVTEIGSSAFDYCTSLTAVSIPASVRKIGPYAFSGCENLTAANISNGVQTIGNGAFSYCTSLTGITIPASVTEIGSYAFSSCENLGKVTIRNGVETIGDNAFESCTSLTAITIPASVIRIGESAFAQGHPAITFKGNAPTIDGDIFTKSSWKGETAILAVYPHGNSTWNKNTMKDYGADRVIWRADNEPAVLPDTAKDDTETLNVTSSNTVGNQNYDVWSTSVNSSLIPMPDGGWTRVEYTGSKVLVEQYSSERKLVWKKTLSMELPLWGGFYSGANYHFLVFGKNNSAEDDSAEVVRVVRYSKNWHRIDSVSVYGANTTIPFAYGSCRITESGDMLYIHTCHQMYTTEDGLRHQANMHFDIYVPTMTIVQQNYLVAYANNDYVSHSFNQFVITDGNDVVKVDHGDAYPRSISLVRFVKSANTLSNNSGSRITLLSFAGEIGANRTGASLGGVAASKSHYLVAVNSIDQSSTGNSQRNIYILAASKENFTDDGVSVIRITNASSSVSTPILVRISSTRFLLLWMQSSKVNYCFLDAAGKRTSEIYVSDGRLSDCQPVVRDNKVTWYVTSGSSPVFYSIDPDNPGSITRY